MPAAFTVEIDNVCWPMEPGTRWTYGEVDAEGNELEDGARTSTAGSFEAVARAAGTTPHGEPHD